MAPTTFMYSLMKLSKKILIIIAIAIYEAKNYLEDIFSTINFNIADNLPFKVAKTESYIVQVKINNTKEIKKYIFDVFKKTDKDVFGNKVEILEKGGITFINTKITSNEVLNYSYYQYNDTEKWISKTMNCRFH